MKKTLCCAGLAAALAMAWLPLEAQKSHGGGMSGGAGGGMGAGAGHGAMGAPGQQPNFPQPRGPQDRQTPGPSQGRPETTPHGNATGRPEASPGSPSGKVTLSGKTSPDQLPSFPKLSSHVEGLLPQGTNLTTAASGFKNLGDFVAAAHVSHNLNIPFDQLKSKMAGGAKLGQAIHELRPEVDSKAEAERATRDAKKALKESGK